MVERVRRARGTPEVSIPEGSVSVYATQFGEETEKTERIVVSKFVSEPAYIRVNAGMTHNMGNYESLRLDVSITMPCYPEEIDTMFPKIAEKVNDYLKAEMENYGVVAEG